MAIRKFTDINNETESKYDRYKNTQIKATIEDVFDTGSALNSPNDAAIQFLKEKLDDIIDENNDKIVGKTPLFVDTSQAITGTKTLGTNTKLQFRDSGIFIHSIEDGTLQITSDNKINILGKTTFTNHITASGDISASGDVTANAFIGDGSSLTSLPSQTDNNFTTTLKNKLDGISAGADVTPSWVPSTNPNYLTSVNAGDVGLGNVTNESKATMFTNAALTGNPTAPTQTANDDSTKIATTAYVQQELTDLIGTAPAALDTLGELSASLAADQTGLASLTTTVGTKLAKSSNLSDLTNAETARTNLGLGSAATSDTGDFAAASHTHAASDITSGTFTTARIPSLATSKITTGTFANARISEASVTQHEGALTITEAQISDLGTYSTATGVENNANNYSLPAAASDTRGGVKIGYSENGKNYPVELSSEKMFVNVPWTDTNTTYSEANSSTLGLVKIGYTENGKNYPVELSSGQMFVNVPWTDTNTTYTVGDGGLTQNNFTDALKTKLDGISTSADVTDATTVAAAGALMDSEVTNLAQVKAFDSSDYATAAQGTTADNALPKAGGTVTGTLNLNSSVNMNGTNDNSTYFAQGNYVEFSNDYLSRNQGNEFLYADRWTTTNITGTFSYGSTNVFRPGDNFAAFVSSTGTNNPVSWEVLTSVTATTNVSARRVAIFAHGGFSCDLRIQVKKSDSTYADIYNDSYTFNGSRWHLFALTGISYPSDWNILGIKVTIDDYGTTTRYIGQIGITNTRNHNTTPYIFRGGGNLYDNSTLSFGNGTDLQIYHDGSNSYIDDTGTGHLNIRANNLQLLNAGGTAYYIDAINGGSVSLFHNASKKLETTSTGVDITGNVVVSGTVDGRDIATDGTKLDGIAANANNYVLPTNLAGDDIDIDTGALTGATVVSDIDINITTNTSGLVTDANGSVSTRTLTKGDLGLGNVPNSDHTAQGYATGDNFDADGTFASLRAQGTTKDDVGLGNVANESRATILGGNLTGTINSVAVATVTAGAALGATSNQDSTATIRSGTTAANVGLGNVTNESKATMFASPTFTGTTAAPTPSANDDSTKIATTAYVQQELTDLIGTAPAALDTLGELSASLANDQDALASLTTTVGTKLAKSSNLSDLADAGTARTNLGVDAAGTDNSTDVTLAGSYDYITISGQTITRNQVDYNTDIANTPTIPTNNNQLTNGAGFTTNTGTVTEVTVGTGLDVSNGTTTPSITLDLSELTDMTSTMASTDEFIVLDNGAERRKAINEIGLNLFSNNAGFLTRADLTRDVINTLPIANGGTGATTAGGALTALGAAASSHTHAASDITSGTLDAARIPDDMDSGKVKQICTTHHNFFMNSTSTTSDFFVPFNNLNESSNPTNAQYYNRMVAPYDGRIVKVVLHTTAAIGTSCQVLFWVATSSGTFAPSAAETVTGVDLNTANSSATATFSTTSTAEFDEGDVLGVSIIKSTTATANMQVTVVWEYTV
jgi:hypothetical protein